MTRRGHSLWHRALRVNHRRRLLLGPDVSAVTVPERQSAVFLVTHYAPAVRAARTATETAVTALDHSSCYVSTSSVRPRLKGDARRLGHGTCSTGATFQRRAASDGAAKHCSNETDARRDPEPQTTADLRSGAAALFDDKRGQLTKSPIPTDLLAELVAREARLSATVRVRASTT